MPTIRDASTLDEATLLEVARVLENHVTDARRERIRTTLDRRTRDITFVFDNLRNPHNGAAVLRTAEAFGFFEVHVVPHGEAMDVSSRVSSGSHKWLDLIAHRTILDAYAVLRRRGFKVFASAVHGDAIPVHEIDVGAPVALVFGNEREGLGPEALREADGRFHIPMMGMVESFNISVAAALSAYDLHRRRVERGIRPSLTSIDRARMHALYLVRSLDSAPLILERAGLPTPTGDGASSLDPGIRIVEGDPHGGLD